MKWKLGHVACAKFKNINKSFMFIFDLIVAPWL